MHFYYWLFTSRLPSSSLNILALYRVLIKYCGFSFKFCGFSRLCQFCCSACFLPAIVYTHWHRGKTEKGQSQEYFKIFGKNTIFNENPVSCIKYVCITDLSPHSWPHRRLSFEMHLYIQVFPSHFHFHPHILGTSHHICSYMLQHGPIFFLRTCIATKTDHYIFFLCLWTI